MSKGRFFSIFSPNLSLFPIFLSIHNPHGKKTANISSQIKKTKQLLLFVVSPINSLLFNPPESSITPRSYQDRQLILLSQISASEEMCTALNSISVAEQEALIEKLQVFRIQGRDKRGRVVLRIVGKFFPVRSVSVAVVNKYLEEKIFPKLLKRPFSVVYINTGIQRPENSPGISVLRTIYDAIPATVKDNLEAVYFVHPGLQARLFLATFGRLMFGGRFYGKVKFVSRVDYLWEHVRRNEVDVPDFVYDHDEDLEYRPMMDYGLESDHPRVYGAPSVDSPVTSYSMRCIS